MVEYLDGGRIQGSSTKVSAPSQTSWKELGRTTLSSAGDTIDVSSFAAKDHLMILAHGIGSGSTGTSTRFNADSGGNYANRWNDDGGSDGSGGSGTRINSDNGTSAGDTFYVANVTNISSQEKLGVWHNVNGNTAGVGNAPASREIIGKWANTSSQITSVNVYNGESGDYASGAEVVVLGYDNDEADSGTNFWQELASVELTSAGDVLDTGTFTAKKYLMMQWQTSPTGGTTDDIKCHFNGDSDSDYAFTRQTDGASGESFTSTANFRIDAGGGAFERDGHAYIINKSDKEKLVIAEDVVSNTAGAGNAPRRFETFGKWGNTSAQITRIQLTNQGTGDFKSGSYLKVWGSD